MALELSSKEVCSMICLDWTSLLLRSLGGEKYKTLEEKYTITDSARSELVSD